MKTLFTSFLLLICFSLSAQFKVLHYTETTGYNHNTKTQSLNMFNDFGPQLNYTVTNDNDGSEFNSLANLQQYHVVVFSNTSGNSGLNATQRANFEAYIDSGGSYLGIHAATDTYRHSSANGNKTGTWDWYAENVAGASVQESPNHTSSSHNNDMTKPIQHPVTDTLPDPWNKTEEYYYWENGYIDTSFTELLRVASTGSKSYDAPRMMAHCKNLTGGGKAFYTALGHAQSNFSNDQNFRALIFSAVEWILPELPSPYPAKITSTKVYGSQLCWEVDSAVIVTVEILIPETNSWQYSVRYHKRKGCHELRGCETVVARVKAIGEDLTEAVSEAHEIEPKPFSHLHYGIFKVDCSYNEPYTVIDTSGRTMMTGHTSDGQIDLQGLSPGFYTVKVADNTYSIIR